MWFLPIQRFPYKALPSKSTVEVNFISTNDLRHEFAHIVVIADILRAGKFPLLFSFSDRIVILPEGNTLVMTELAQEEINIRLLLVVSQPNQITSVEIVLILPSCVSTLTDR